MDVKINSEIVEQAINNSASKAIAEALGGYKVTTAIAEVVTEQIAEGAIAEAIRRAVDNIDTEALVQHLAVEIQRAVTRATINLLHEGLVSTICKLRGIGDYTDEDRQKRACLKAELFGQ